MTDTRVLAEFTANLKLDDVPAAVRERARIVLLDGIGCLLAGTAARLSRDVAMTFGAVSGGDQATILATGKNASARDAALANAIALYGVGLNDIHKPSGTHPGGCVIPAAIAMAEQQDASGAEMLTAMIAGYEVNGRIGMAVKGSHRARGFHPTGTCGTFGAAAAAGRLAGADADDMLDIFGIAGSQASGLYEFHHTGSTTMIYHAARAAQNGVEAVMMASAGLTGPETVLEGGQGFYAAMAGEVDRGAITDGLENLFMISGTSLRPQFGCNSTKSTSAALARFLKSGVAKADEIAGIQIAVHPLPARDNDIASPDSLLGARLSLQYNAALVLAHGDVVVRDLTEADLADPEVRRHLGMVSITADASMSRYACAITLTFRNGGQHICRDEGLHGDSADPLSWEDVSAKIRALVQGVVGESSIDTVIDMVEHIEEHSGKQIAATLAGAVGSGQMRA